MHYVEKQGKDHKDILKTKILMKSSLSIGNLCL